MKNKAIIMLILSLAFLFQSILGFSHEVYIDHVGHDDEILTGIEALSSPSVLTPYHLLGSVEGVEYVAPEPTTPSIFTYYTCCGSDAMNAHPTLHYYDGEAPDPITYIPISIGGITIFIPKESIGLAKDPGQKGRDTIAGVDSDEDGVRDDIERYIAYKYPHDRLLRANLYRIAQVLKWMIPDNGFVSSLTTTSSSQCLLEYRKDQQDGQYIFYDLLAEYLNTKERSLTYVKIGSLDKINVQNDDCFNKAWVRKLPEHG